MARAESLSDNVLEVVAEQIGTMFAGVYDREELVGATVEMGETFEVWVLMLDAVRQPPNDLSLLATPAGRWHHQIKRNNVVEAFARSVPLGEQPGSWEVMEVYQSEIAGKIDRAVTWIEEHVDDTWTVRLLDVPDYQVYALWLLSDEGAGRVFVVDCPARLIGLLQAEQPVSQEYFLGALRSTPPIIGISRSESRAVLPPKS